MSTFKNLKDGFSKYTSVKVHVIVAVLQFMIALILMPAVMILRISNVPSYVSPYIDKPMFYIEQIMYILFEAFRLWLVLDSIVQKNSLTILVTGLLAVIVLANSVITFFEDFETIGFSNTIATHTIIEFAFGCSLIVLTFPALWAAYKMSRDFGWGIYKKIGASLDIQKKYRAAQCFLLALKLDLFFEFIYFQLNVSWFYQWNHSAIEIVTYFISFFSLIIAREAIARENYILMVMALCMQIEYLVVIINFANTLSWPMFMSIPFFIYSACSILCCVGTILLGIWYLFNFNKGLKEHVQWSFFGLRKRPMLTETRSKQDASEGLLSTKIEIPIDED